MIRHYFRITIEEPLPDAEDVSAGQRTRTRQMLNTIRSANTESLWAWMTAREGKFTTKRSPPMR